MVGHSRAQHVWVSLTGVWGDAALPGLLIGWRRTRRGEWEGWVISAEPVVGAHDAGPYVRQSWVPAAAIRPLGGASPRSWRA